MIHVLLFSIRRLFKVAGALLNLMIERENILALMLTFYTSFHMKCMVFAFIS